MLQSWLGFMAILTIAWAFSEKRHRIPWPRIGMGIGVQFALAFLLFQFPPVTQAFLLLNDAVLALENATHKGTAFVFGYLGGDTLPFASSGAGSNFILAFQALPLLLVISAIASVLFYWRVLPWIVKGFGWGLQKTMGVGGALGFGAASTIFVGMIEAPLLIRPYLREMTRSEIFAMMTAGMACIAGTVMVLYASILKPVVPDALGHILIASMLSAPAALVIAFIMVPETETPSAGQFIPAVDTSSTMDAISKGTIDGLHLLLQVCAFLVVLVSLVALANSILSLLPDFGNQPLTLQRTLGWIMAPLVWLLGIPWSEAPNAGALLGTKIVLNELIAYLDMAALPPESFSPRSRLIMTYALCGFANLGSLGILIGGLGSMVPERRQEIVNFGGRSIISGTLASCMSGAQFGIWHG